MEKSPSLALDCEPRSEREQRREAVHSLCESERLYHQYWWPMASLTEQRIEMLPFGLKEFIYISYKEETVMNSLCVKCLCEVSCPRSIFRVTPPSLAACEHQRRSEYIDRPLRLSVDASGCRRPSPSRNWKRREEKRRGAFVTENWPAG